MTADVGVVVLDILAGEVVLAVEALVVLVEVRLPVSTAVDVAPELRELAVVEGRLKDKKLLTLHFFIDLYQGIYIF